MNSVKSLLLILFVRINKIERIFVMMCAVNSYCLLVMSLI